MAGLPKAIIAKYGITKKAWAVFRGKHHSPISKTKKVGKRRMARRYFARRRHRTGGMTIPLAPIIGLAAGVAPSLPFFMAGDIQNGVEVLKYNYLGLNQSNQFEFEGFRRGTLPLVIGLLVHKFVGGAPLNANRALAKARVPLIRI